jgi:hypothetical protein
MEEDVLQQIVYSIQSGLGEVKEESREFRMEAERQNFSMSKFMSDLSSKFFITQNKQQSDLNDSMDEVERQSTATNQSINELQSITQESVSLLSNISSQMKEVAQGIGSLVQLFQQSAGANEFSFGNMVGQGLGALVGGAAATAAIGGGLASLTDVGSAEAGQILPSGGGNSDTGGSGQALSVAEMTRLAKQAGFSDQEAAIMGAIGAAESSGNPKAHNPDATTGDNSYGLWQINMLGRMGPERRNQFGIENNERLWDPNVNAKAAKTIYEQQGFNAWSVYKSGAYKQYLGTAQESLKGGVEKDDKSASPGTIVQKDNIMGGKGSVQERQHELAGIRKLPLNPKLKSILDKAADSVGVEAVVFSGGQNPKGSGGPRTGSTRHDHGNAADLYLVKDGRKLVDTNPEDRAIMTKFVSSAVASGATGVGAGHGYMGPSNIHIGFGKQATWGGASWIQSAAAGITNNKDLSSENGYSSGSSQSASGSTGISGEVGGESNPFAGTPFAGLSEQIAGALGSLTSIGGMGAGMLTGGGGIMGAALPMLGGLLPSLTSGISSIFSSLGNVGKLSGLENKSDAQPILQNDKTSPLSEMSNNLTVEKTVAELTKQEIKVPPVVETATQNRPVEGVRGPSFSPTPSSSIGWVDRLGGRNKFPKSFNINGVYSA